jgi:hypothetical protein
MTACPTCAQVVQPDATERTREPLIVGYTWDRSARSGGLPGGSARARGSDLIRHLPERPRSACSLPPHRRRGSWRRHAAAHRRCARLDRRHPGARPRHSAIARRRRDAGRRAGLPAARRLGRVSAELEPGALLAGRHHRGRQSGVGVEGLAVPGGLAQLGQKALGLRLVAETSRVRWKDASSAAEAALVLGIRPGPPPLRRLRSFRPGRTPRPDRI